MDLILALSRLNLSCTNPSRCGNLLQRNGELFSVAVLLVLISTVWFFYPKLKLWRDR